VLGSPRVLLRLTRPNGGTRKSRFERAELPYGRFAFNRKGAKNL
jgi:hypothetical protein